MRLAVIGAGRMGRRHVAVVRKLGLDLVGVADQSTASLDAAANEYSLESDVLFDRPALMLERCRPDVVVVATTAPSHAELTLAAFEAGATHVLCEKPMATSLADCDRMIEAAAAHKAHLAVNHQMRYMEQYTETKAVVERDTFGGLTSITVVGGNFGLAMNGLHYFEALRYLFGSPAARVSAWLGDDPLPNPRGPQFSDRSGQVRAETADGRRMYLDCGADQGYGMLAIYAGRYGQLVVDELSGHVLVSERTDDARPLPTSRYGGPAVTTARTIPPAEIIGPTASVLTALLAGEDYPSGVDGRAAIATLVAAYMSHELQHTPVDVASTEAQRDRSFPWA